MKHTCLYCKTEFEAPRKDKNYCNASCRQQAYMLRKGTAMAGFEINKIAEQQELSQESEQVGPVIEVTKKEKEFYQRAGKFISHVVELMEQRNYEYLLQSLRRENAETVKSQDWFNVRLRCLVECLLTLSERKTILLSDLAEITNAFTLLIRSSHFQNLPEPYPYTHKVKELRNKLRSIYTAAEDMEEFHLNLGKNLKIELIAMRCELRTVALRKSYNQLQFKEEKKPCKPDHHPEKKPPLKQWQINLNKIRSEKQ